MNDPLSVNSLILVQPRPQCFSLKKWVGPHPFFKGKGKKGKSTGDEVDFVGKSLGTKSCQFRVPGHRTSDI